MVVAAVRLVAHVSDEYTYFCSYGNRFLCVLQDSVLSI